jgi:hypothetical protein
MPDIPCLSSSLSNTQQPLTFASFTASIHRRLHRRPQYTSRGCPSIVANQRSVHSLACTHGTETYAFVDAIPDPIRDCVECPNKPSVLPSPDYIPAGPNVHLKSERRCEHNTEEDVVFSEEEAICPFTLAIDPSCRVYSRASRRSGCCRKGQGDLLVERSAGGRLPLKTLAISAHPYNRPRSLYIPL